MIAESEDDGNSDLCFSWVILVYISSMASVETFWDAGHKITGHDVGGSLSLGYR